MFEIGESLRYARERQGLELSDVERATRIGAIFLSALEQERFERLPGRAYAKAFLRGYAEFLGLDAKLFAEEFDARFAEPEPEPPPLPSPRWRLPAPTRGAVALVAVGIAALVSILAFAFSGGTPQRAGRPLTPSRPTRPPPPPPSRPAPVRSPSPGPAVANLLVTAGRGDCWLSVRAESATGPLLYEGILTTGHSLRFARSRLWIRIGAPWNLTARLDGTAVTDLPAQTGDVLVTPAGIEPQP